MKCLFSNSSCMVLLALKNEILNHPKRKDHKIIQNPFIFIMNNKDIPIAINKSGLFGFNNNALKQHLSCLFGSKYLAYFHQS